MCPLFLFPLPFSPLSSLGAFDTPKRPKMDLFKCSMGPCRNIQLASVARISWCLLNYFSLQSPIFFLTSRSFSFITIYTIVSFCTAQLQFFTILQRHMFIFTYFHMCFFLFLAPAESSNRALGSSLTLT